MKTKQLLRGAATFLICNLPALCVGGGRTAISQVAANTSGEISSTAYSVSLICIIGAAWSWFRHGGEMGHLAGNITGVALVSGVALGAGSLLGMIPGVTGLAV